jgi:DNA-binding transcriptional MerR regulator
MEQKIFTRKETAKKFNVSANTLLNWEKHGEIESPKRIGRRCYWTENQINRILGEAPAPRS